MRSSSGQVGQPQEIVGSCERLQAESDCDDGPGQMKVLHVIPSISPVHGGPSRAMVDIERALATRGIEVTTATTNDDGGPRTLAVPCSVPVATTYATRWYFPRSTVFYKVSSGLYRWLSDNIETFDLVHAHALFSFAPIAAGHLARRAGVPYILRPLGVLAAYGVTQRRPFLKRLSLALVERRLIESASAVHFTSEAELSEAKALGLNCNGVVVPLGIDVKNSMPTVRAERRGVPNLLYLSRIDPKKNVEGLLHAVQIALSRGAQFELNIAGSGDPNYISSLKLLSSQLKVDKHVNWLGYAEGERKHFALGTASAFVLPSYSENFGIAVVEALAAGLPCIVSRGVAISDEIQRAGAGIVIGTTPEEIAAGIEKIVGNEQDRSTMAIAARALASNAFSLDAMGARLEGLYRDILKSEKSRSAAQFPE